MGKYNYKYEIDESGVVVLKGLPFKSRYVEVPREKQFRMLYSYVLVDIDLYYAGGIDFTGGIYGMKRSVMRRVSRTFLLSLCICMLTATTAYATGGDPLTIVNNLSDFIFSIIKAIGIIILGWGIVQVGMSIQSHDASQRTQGLLCLFGGLLITFAKEILTLIGAV